MSDHPPAAQSEVSKLRLDFAELKADTLKRFREIDKRFEQVEGNHNDLDDQSDERHDAVQKWQADTEKRIKVVEDSHDHFMGAATASTMALERIDKRMVAMMEHLRIPDPKAEPIPDPEATP